MSARVKASIAAAVLCLSGCTIYTYTIFDFNNDAAATSAHGINNSGKIVGTYVPRRPPPGKLVPPTLSFLGEVQNGQFTGRDVSDPDAAETYAFKIDNRGQIVGWSSRQGFISPNGVVFDPIEIPNPNDPPHPFRTQVFGINDVGNAVGHYFSGPVGHGFVLNNHIPFDRQNTQDTTPTDINNSRDVTGFFFGSDGRNHCFLADLNRNFATIDPSNTRDAECWGINDPGQVVGWQVSARDGNIYGFVRNADRSVTVIHCPGSSITKPFGINNSGQIVGECIDSSGHHGFLATPP
jgi:uncharacterized membrane protein